MEWRSEWSTCIALSFSSSGRGVGSSSPSISVKTVPASEVEGEGAVMSSGVVAVSSTGGAADRWVEERAGENLVESE